jgi:hypothetical protein
MRFHDPDNRKLTALGLLVVFVVGGLLMPVLHRADHGLQWANLRGDVTAAEACDHSRHGDGFEATLPAFHDDLCALCTRPLVSLLDAHVGVQARQAFALFLAPIPSFVAHGSDALLSIRAPPFAA